MKVDAKIFKGIEYVRVSELPQAQREMLTQSISPDLFIKLLIDGKIVSGCLQYKDYSHWYQNHYSMGANAAREENFSAPADIKPNLALNKV